MSGWFDYSDYDQPNWGGYMRRRAGGLAVQATFSALARQVT